MTKHLENGIKIIIKVLFIVFSILFFVLSITQSSYMLFTPYSHKMVYTFINPLSVIVFIVVVLLILFTKDLFSPKYLLIFEMCLFFIGGTIYCLQYSNILPSNDSLDLYATAQSMYNGAFDVLDSKTYIGEHPNNIGMLFIYYFFIKVFGNGALTLTFMRLLNLAFSILAYIYLYKVTKSLFNNEAILNILLVMYLGFNHLILYSVFVYTNVISYGLSIISIYYLIEYLKNRDYSFIISLITICISVVVRENSLIVLIAEIGTLFLTLLNEKSKPVLILLIVFLCAIFTPKLTVKTCESIYDVSYDNQLPLKAFLCHGVNYNNDTPGGYNVDFHEMFVSSGYDKKLVNEYADKVLNDTFDYFAYNPIRCIDFYGKKFISSWCDPNYDVFSNNFNKQNTIMDKQGYAIVFYDAYLSVLSIGVLVYSLKRKRTDDWEVVLPLTIIGGFLFHSFWEVKAIYTYLYILLLLPLSSWGIEEITILAKKKFNKRQKHHKI